jgi:hypothetical protein
VQTQEVSKWHQDRRTTEAGGQELTEGNFHTVAIFLNGETVRTEEEAWSTGGSARTEEEVTTEEKHSIFDHTVRLLHHP